MHPHGARDCARAVRSRLGWCLLALWLLGAGLATAPAAEPVEVRIALRAHVSAGIAVAQWQPTADYLSEKIPGYRFVVVPFENLAEELEAVSRQEFQFVLTNPSSYVEYNYHYGARALATLVNRRQGAGYDRFGSVIFTRADRDDIRHVHDLTGKKVMAVAERAFGGWRVAWREFRQLGVDPFRDFDAVMYAGGVQPTVVQAVHDGIADAGVVRTDMLEHMAERGEIALSDFKVLNAKSDQRFPFAHSTPLYPEWPFARLPHTPDGLANQVARALLVMPEGHPASITGDYVGWNTPADYEPVRDLLKELAIGPYAGQGDISGSALMRAYGGWIMLGTALLFTLVCMTVRMKVLNNRLRETERKLQDLAMHDGLTGLSNRHHLDLYLDQVWRLAVRNRRPLTVMMIDIDQFKQYNDSYGHVAGDDCLRKVARVAERQFRRANDLVVRYGGEEILVMLQDVTAAQAREQAEAVRQGVQGLRLPHDASFVARHLTVSVGLATCIPGPNNTPQQLIEAADRALYEAKAQGRNRVVATDTSLPVLVAGDAPTA